MSTTTKATCEVKIASAERFPDSLGYRLAVAEKIDAMLGSDLGETWQWYMGDDPINWSEIDFETSDYIDAEWEGPLKVKHDEIVWSYEDGEIVERAAVECCEINTRFYRVTFAADLLNPDEATK